MRAEWLDKRVFAGTWLNYAFSTAFGLCMTALTAYQITVTRKLTDSIVIAESLRTPLEYLALLCTLLLLVVIMRHIQELLQQQIQLRIDYNLDHVLLRAVQPQTITRIETAEYQNELNVVRFGMQSIGRLYLSFIKLGTALVSIGTYLVIVFQQVWYLPLVIVIGTLPRFVHEIRMAARRYAYTEQTTEVARERRNLQDLLWRPAGLKERLVFGAKSFLSHKWDRAYTEELRHNKSFNILETRKKIGLGITVTVTQIAVQFILVYEIVMRSATIGTYVSIIAALSMIDAAMLTFASYTGQMKQFRMTKAKMDAFLGKYSTPTGAAATSSVPRIDRIELADLRFQYPNRTEPALSGIRLTLERTETVVIVGQNGSGKSTLAKALTGLHDAPDASVFYDGTDLNTVSREDVYRRFSMVTQDYGEYPFTVLESVTMRDDAGAPDRFERLRRAYPYLIDLEPGTVLGYEYRGGKQVSGGQWQKIAIARALCKDADFLIFDEATSALDPETEFRLFRDIMQHRNRQGLIAITHRLHICPLFDKIIVMHRGRIAETGRHVELMQARGIYYEMFSAQQYRETKEEIADERFSKVFQ